MNQTERETKVFNLNVELENVLRFKKSTNKAHNEEIKRIKSEIKSLLDDAVATQPVQ